MADKEDQDFRHGNRRRCMKGYSKEQVGRNHGRIRRLLLLAACAALAAGGCAAQDGTDSVQNPAYVYYIKDADLMLSLIHI